MRGRTLSRSSAAVAVTLLATGVGCAGISEHRVGLPTLTSGASTVQMTGMTGGTLVVERGCIRLPQPRGPSRLVVWPHGTRLAGAGREQIALPNGKTMAVGEEVTLGGGEINELAPAMLEAPLADVCTGPYFIAADRIQ